MSFHKKIKRTASILFFILYQPFGFAQTKNIYIPFLENMPAIDGREDDGLKSIPWHSFSHIERSRLQNEDCGVRYKIAYTYRHLYLLIESDADSIVFRDRAYQNGDGFHLVIAKADSGGSTDEFYVLRFSPENSAKTTKAKKSIWYYNKDLSSRALTNATQFTCACEAGKSYFELLLPWDEVVPYHPVFSNRIGINLCFVKAIGSSDKNYYYMLYDNRMQSELSLRKFIPIEFEPPKIISDFYSLARLERNNATAGRDVKIRVASLSSHKNVLIYRFSIGSRELAFKTDIQKQVIPATNPHISEFILPLAGAAPGNYRIKWDCSDGSGDEMNLTLFPALDDQEEQRDLNLLKKNISPGTFYTLSFMLQDLLETYHSIKEYETGNDFLEKYYLYSDWLSQLKKGNDFLKDRQGIFRRAFLSKIDHTLQPYSVKIPEHLDLQKKYPLLVMLHGSGSDDRIMLTGTPLSKNNFIEIAPYGRGTSNCFTSDHAEIDVKEAIEDAVRNYPIDTSKIIIAGFSMGGYGAYRIFYEYPGLFRGIAVFSDHPNLANKWLGEGYPDFLDAKFLTPFKGIPVFIYHSFNDLNCPYPLTEELVKKLKECGAEVDFITVKEGGHGIMDENQMPVYYEWLKKITHQ